HALPGGLLHLAGLHRGTQERSIDRRRPQGPDPAAHAGLTSASECASSRTARVGLAAVLVLVAIDQVAQGATGEVLEPLLEQLQLGHAVRAEIAKILTQLAVTSDGPALAPKGERKWPDGARGRSATFVDVL